MFKIKCSNCGYEKNEFDIICSNCAYVEKKDDFIKRLNKMYANRMYGKYGIPANKIDYTDTDSIFYHGGLVYDCNSYLKINGIKMHCQLKMEHNGRHIISPIIDGNMTTILW